MGDRLKVLILNGRVFLMKSIAAGKENIGLPDTEQRVWTNFTR